MVAVKDLIIVRPYVEADRNFVLATWIRGAKHGSDFFKRMDPKAYYRHYNEFLSNLVDSSTTDILMACLAEDPTVILGYAVTRNQGQSLDWVYVKHRWRKIGIAKTLVLQPFSEVSHLTDVGEKILRKTPNVTFNPFID